MTMKLVFLCLVLTSLVKGAMWSSSPPPPHHQVIVKEPHRVVVVEFEEQRKRNTKVVIAQHDYGGNLGGEVARWLGVVEDAAKAAFTGSRELFTKCRHKLATALGKTKNVVHNLEEHAKEVVDETVGKVGEPKLKLSEKLSEKVKTIGEKSSWVAGNAKTAIDQAIGMLGLGDSAEGTLKDSVVKMQNWDLVDSPKRIGEDIERNASRKVEQGAEEVKETVQNVKETSLSDLLRKSKKMIGDVFMTISLDKIRSMISWCHLLGLSTAYGMGVWFTLVWSCVVGKCLPKQQLGMVIDKMKLVYSWAMTYCVGAALVGYLVSQGKKGMLSNKMELFQGFNLLSAFFMSLTNLMFLDPRATKKLIGGGWKEKLKKKMNASLSTLNVSTLVLLTWHLAYMGQLLQPRRH